MRWRSDFKHPDGLYFIIERQILRNLTEQKDEEGFYLYVYEHIEPFNTDLNDPQGDCSSHQRDYLQDTLQMAQDQALEEFGVPLDAWKQIG